MEVCSYSCQALWGGTADALCVEDLGLQREPGALSASCCSTHGLSLMLAYVHAERGSSSSVKYFLRATIKPHDRKGRQFSIIL
jgi:hypothetical protein